MNKYIPKPFGIPAWSGVKRRIAKKVINSLGRGMLQRYQDFHGKKIGDLISTCSSLNERVIEIESVYNYTRRGMILIDIIFYCEHSICSMYNCGVGLPITYEEAVEKREQIIKGWKDNDVWGFAERYSNYILHKDGRFQIKGET